MSPCPLKFYTCDGSVQHVCVCVCVCVRAVIVTGPCVPVPLEILYLWWKCTACVCVCAVIVTGPCVPTGMMGIPGIPTEGSVSGGTVDIVHSTLH